MTITYFSHNVLKPFTLNIFNFKNQRQTVLTIILLSLKAPS